MTRETFALHCQACRYAVLHVQTEDLARELARAHGERGHVVEVSRETRETIVTFGATCERVSGHTAR